MLGLTWPCDVSLHVALSFAFKGFEGENMSVWKEDDW